MILLAIDTALDACSVAVVRGGEPLAVLSEPMSRGHQERLAPMVEAAMGRTGLGFAELERIAVTVGPGSFTGLRVGLAFAKGLSLALGVPCVGVGTLEALAAGEAGGRVVAAIDAKLDQLYLQPFLDGSPRAEPRLVQLAAAGGLVEAALPGAPEALTLTGPGAARLATVLQRAVLTGRATPDPVALARLAAARPALSERPRPLYLRPPDARTLAERGRADPAAAASPSGAV